MKKLFILFAFLTLISCSKEKGNDASIVSNKSNEIKLFSYSNGTKNPVTMLEFTSFQAYQNAINSLEQQLDVHIDNFYNQYGSLSDEEYDLKKEMLGFNEQQPIIDFLTANNFLNSMFTEFKYQEDLWMENDLDDSKWPGIAYPFAQTEMALLNNLGEVKLGSNFLKLTDKGYLYITDGDLNKLIRFNNGDQTVLNEPNVSTNINRSQDNECDNWKSRDITDHYESGKKVIMYVHFHSYPTHCVSCAEITSYKINSHGKWKRYSMDMCVTVEALTRDKDCGAYTSYGYPLYKCKKRETLERNHTVLGSYLQYRVRNGEGVKGYYSYAGRSNTLMLTW